MLPMPDDASGSAAADRLLTLDFAGAGLGTLASVVRFAARTQARPDPHPWRAARVLLLRGFGHGLVAFIWRHAHLFSLAHDVSDGGVELALREAAAWSGLDADADPIDGPGVIVATRHEIPWDDIVELGAVG